MRRHSNVKIVISFYQAPNDVIVGQKIISKFPHHIQNSKNPGEGEGRSRSYRPDGSAAGKNDPQRDVT